MASLTLDITKNEAKKQFEAPHNGYLAFITYMYARGAIYLTHTEVPKELEGQGVGSALVKGVLDMIDAADEKLWPLCPFVAAYIRRHPEYKQLLADGARV